MNRFLTATLAAAGLALSAFAPAASAAALTGLASVGNGNAVSLFGDVPGRLGVDVDFTAPGRVSVRGTVSEAGGDLGFNAVFNNLVGEGFSYASLALTGGLRFATPAADIAGLITPTFGSLASVTLNDDATRLDLAFVPAEPNQFAAGNPFDLDGLSDLLLSFDGVSAGDVVGVDLTAQVPLPATPLLLGAGLLAIAINGRRAARQPGQ